MLVKGDVVTIKGYKGDGQDRKGLFESMSLAKNVITLHQPEREERKYTSYTLDHCGDIICHSGFGKSIYQG